MVLSSRSFSNLFRLRSLTSSFSVFVSYVKTISNHRTSLQDKATRETRRKEEKKCVREIRRRLRL